MYQDSSEDWEEEWEKDNDGSENRNITPFYPSRIPDLTFSVKEIGGSWE
jgi:hypothetical protein